MQALVPLQALHGTVKLRATQPLDSVGSVAQQRGLLCHGEPLDDVPSARAGRQGRVAEGQRHALAGALRRQASPGGDQADAHQHVERGETSTVQLFCHQRSQCSPRYRRSSRTLRLQTDRHLTRRQTRTSTYVGEGVSGGRVLSFFSPLPQNILENILVPPTPATGRRFPLLCVRKK